MVHADYLVIFLEVFYLVIMGAYIWAGDWKKATYWFGAVIINIAVIFMER